MIPLVLAATAGITVSWWLTGVVRRYALASATLDIPNARSSHSVPTPRGGGLAIASVCLAGMVLLAWLQVVDLAVTMALAGGGGLIAAIGWVDDRRGVPPSIRFLAHLVAAVWALVWLGGLSSIDVGHGTFDLGGAGFVLGLLTVVWCTNLYNFMDGIDGIAAGEAVSVGAVGGLLLLAAGSPGLAAVAFLIAAASGGFLAWNWAPAKIFMGDVGSGLLGFLLAVLAIASENQGAVPLLVWVILAGVFVFDATATLVRRALRGERLYEAHRSHAYQRMVQSGWSHSRTTAAVLLLNLALAVLAMIASARPAWLPPAGVAALLALAGVYRWVEGVAPMRPPPTPQLEERRT